MSAAIAAKARRLLTAGRLHVLHVDGEIVRAEVDGDHGRYQLRVIRGQSVCSCPARIPCSHLEALRLVVPVPE